MSPIRRTQHDKQSRTIVTHRTRPSPLIRENAAVADGTKFAERMRFRVCFLLGYSGGGGAAESGVLRTLCLGSVHHSHQIPRQSTKPCSNSCIDAPVFSSTIPW